MDLVSQHEGLESFIMDELADLLDAIATFADRMAIELFPTGAYRRLSIPDFQAGVSAGGIVIEVPDLPPDQAALAADTMRADFERAKARLTR